VYLEHNNNFIVEADAYKKEGFVWRLCNGREYSFELENGNDHVVIQTRDAVLYDNYKDAKKNKFTVSCSAVTNDKKLPDDFTFNASQTSDKSGISVAWDKDVFNGATVDVLDNGVVVAKGVDGYTGGVTFDLYKLEEGVEHFITVRESSVHPEQTTMSVKLSLPCDDLCELFVYEASDFVDGYVTVVSKSEPHITYFAGSSSSTHDMVSFYVCSGDLVVSPVLHNDGSGSRFVIVHNDTGLVTATDEGEWNLPTESIVVDTTFENGAEEFEFVCESCYPAVVGNYSLEVKDDGNETLQLKNVKSHFGNVWISVDGGDAEEYTVGSDKNISIDFSSVHEKYCFTYASCSENIDQNQSKCLESLHCSPPVVEYDVKYVKSESFTVRFKCDYYQPLITFNYLRVVVDGEDKTIDLIDGNYTPSEQRELNLTVEQLMNLLEKNVCVAYSFTGCGATYENSLCSVLEKKSIIPLVAGIVAGGLVLAAALAGLIAFLIKRPRGESREVMIEMEFPDDEEPDEPKMVDMSGKSLSGSASESEESDKSSSVSSEKSSDSESSKDEGSDDEDDGKKDDKKDDDNKESSDDDKKDDKDKESSDDDKKDDKDKESSDDEKDDDAKESSDDESLTVSSASDDDDD